MYTSGPVMVWELAGRPRRASLPAEPVPAVCAMCGRHVTESVHVKHTIAGKSFTDQYLLACPDSDRTCYACAWACTGKGMDQVRMWTIVARTDRTLPPSNPKAAFATEHVHFTSRADMRLVVDTLANPPDGDWLVCVAESGQKHTLPYTKVNHGAGQWRVRMDALDIVATPEQFRHVFGHVIRLRAAGFTPEEIETLTPAVGRLTADTLPVWQHHAGELTPWRGSPLIHLAVFLPTKEHLNEYLTLYGPADQLGCAVPGRDAGLGRPGSDRPQELVGPGPHSVGDGNDHPVLF